MAEYQSFTRRTALTDFYPLPRSVLDRGLTAVALLLYAVLLDRATLSRKNSWTDDDGRVYVIYPIEKLADTLRVRPTAVKRHLTELERGGLIERQRPVKNGPSHIFLRIPKESGSPVGQQQNAPSDGAETTRSRGRKVAVNNRREQRNYNDLYYQHGEDESL